MRIQVRASSQTKGVEQGWKQWRECEALTPRFTDFFTDFEEKPTVLQSRGGRQRASVERRLGVVVGADCFTLTKTWNRKPY